MLLFPMIYSFKYVKQGIILSPCLFNLFMNWCIARPIDTGVLIFYRYLPHSVKDIQCCGVVLVLVHSNINVLFEPTKSYNIRFSLIKLFEEQFSASGPYRLMVSHIWDMCCQILIQNSSDIVPKKSVFCSQAKLLSINIWPSNKIKPETNKVIKACKINSFEPIMSAASKFNQG